MSKKKINHEYEIQYRVEAVIALFIKAENEDVAKEKADEILKKELFADGIEYQDGKQTYMGFSNMDFWNFK